MEQYANEKEKLVVEFKSYMRQAIINCARNVLRMMKNAEDKNGGISLEALDEYRLGEFMATEDEHGFENGIEFEITNMKIRLNNDQIEQLLTGLTEREVQALILHEAFDYDYASIGRLLGITADRAKAYKYHALKKAKRRANKHGRK